jgi:cytochrome c-type biogenesis protein CcmH/NrfG
MRARRDSRALTAVAAALVLAIAAGCNMGIGNYCATGARDEAVVQMGNDSMTVASGCDDDSRVGVRELRAQNWEGAVASLQRASQLHPDDWRTAFALGVAYEQLGRRDEALAAYRRANANLGGKGNPDVTAAVLRTSGR